jgi:hypothetical protein
MTYDKPIKEFIEDVYARLQSHLALSQGRVGASVLAKGRAEYELRHPPNFSSEEKGKKLENAVYEALLEYSIPLREVHSKYETIKGYIDFLVPRMKIGYWDQRGYAKIQSVQAPFNISYDIEGNLTMDGTALLLESKFRTNGKFEWTWITQVFAYWKAQAEVVKNAPAVIIYGNDAGIESMVLEFTKNYESALWPTMYAQTRALLDNPKKTVGNIPDDKILNSFPSTAIENAIANKTKTATIRFGQKEYLIGDIVTLTCSWDRRHYMKLMDRAVITEVATKKFGEITDEEARMEVPDGNKETLRQRLEELYHTKISNDDSMTITKWDYNIPKYVPMVKDLTSAQQPAEPTAPASTQSTAVIEAPVTTVTSETASTDSSHPNTNTPVSSFSDICSVLRVAEALYAASSAGRVTARIDPYLSVDEIKTMLETDGFTIGITQYTDKGARLEVRRKDQPRMFAGTVEYPVFDTPLFKMLEEVVPEKAESIKKSITERMTAPKDTDPRDASSSQVPAGPVAEKVEVEVKNSGTAVNA